VSTANVSQLAVDLLIASFSLHRIGIFDSGFFVPVVGGRENGEEGVTTPLERRLILLHAQLSIIG
jgi:proteasome assembly chaperone 2